MVNSMRAVVFLFAIYLLAALSPPADAQQNPTFAKVVSACGTLPSGVTYAVGQSYPITMDPTGKLCDGSSGGGTATVIANQGTAGSSGQAWFIQSIHDYAQGSTTSGQIGPLVQGAVVSGAPSYTAATTQPITLSTTGLLRSQVIAPSGQSIAQAFTVPLTAPNGGVGISGVFFSTAPTLTNGQADGIQLDANGNLLISARAITPVVTNSGASLVIKGTPGNLYSVTATNLTATAGVLMVINATTAPSSASSVTPLACVPLPASGVANINYNPGPPAAYSTGIVALVSTPATTCATFTSGTLTAFISGAAQ